MSSALRTSTRSTPLGVSSAVGPVTSTTFAPRRAAARATAYPIFPDDRLLKNRTGSMSSRVGPAVTRTPSPSRSCRPRNTSSTAFKISTWLASRPGPVIPHAPRAQGRKVLLRRLVLPHVDVHRRSRDYRCRRRQVQRAQKVVRDSPRKLRKNVGRGRRDEQQIRALSHRDMVDCGLEIVLAPRRG